jgi:uncharacterized lipoprotein
MTKPNALSRTAISIALAASLLALSGCSWFRSASPYSQSPEDRPLEVPPDLSLPNTTQAMRVPAATTPTAAAAPTAASAAFVIADSKASAWRRVGLALDRIEGVVIGERVELVGAYNITFRGESLLVRAAEEGQGARISAVTSDGREATTSAAAALLGELRTRLL